MSLFRSSPSAARPETPSGVPVTLVVENDRGRVGLLAWAERALPPGKVLVQVKDLVGERRSFRTLPASKAAELVASERPVILRGGLTSLVSYYVVPSDDLDAREEHFQGAEMTHHYDVKLRVVSRGRAPAKRELAA